MAQLIPERLSNRVTASERRLYAALARLPADCLVYFEPVVANRYPDFIVIAPSLGVLRGGRRKRIIKHVKAAEVCFPSFAPRQFNSGDRSFLVVGSLRKLPVQFGICWKAGSHASVRTLDHAPPHHPLGRRIRQLARPA